MPFVRHKPEITRATTSSPAPSDSVRKILYGKDATEKVVAVENDNGVASLIIQTDDGYYKTVEQESAYWALSPKKYKPDFQRLEGDQHYKYVWVTDNKDDYERVQYDARRYKYDNWVAHSYAEQHMLRSGVTQFKNTEIDDVRVLSFDIETTGFDPLENSVLLISNTFRCENGHLTKKLFSIDEFETEQDMIQEWCVWVTKQDPSFLLGHNIFSFDIPFLFERSNHLLHLGRDGSNIELPDYENKFRRDATQFYTFHNFRIWGRQIIDTFYLSIKYDIGRVQESYGLKPLVEALSSDLLPIKQKYGLDKRARQHYDAAEIKNVEIGSEEWQKVKQYAIDDADDALLLYELMIPAYFFLARSVPKTLQDIVWSGTGGQVNSLIVRAYIQEKHSIPKASPKVQYEGATTWGKPGVYKDVYACDAASLYPSIIIQHKVCDKKKDPKGHLLTITEAFTKNRLKNKKLGKTSKTHLQLSNAEKIIINSIYGFMGSTGLNFNFPKGAEFITRIGRETLQSVIDAAEARGYIVPRVDTDGVSFCGVSSEKEVKEFIDSLNSIDDGITWENDGYYKVLFVAKSKNYAQIEQLEDGSLKRVVKGSALKATTKERALKKYIGDIIDCFLYDRQHQILDLYEDMTERILDIKDISDWCSKKTVTEAVLNPSRTNEQRVLDAITEAKLDVAQGDKVYIFFEEPTKLKIREKFSGQYDAKTLLKKLYKSTEIFEQVIEMSAIPKYHNKKQFEALVARK